MKLSVYQLFNHGKVIVENEREMQITAKEKKRQAHLVLFSFLIKVNKKTGCLKSTHFSIFLPSSVRFTIDAAVGWLLVESSVFDSLLILSIIMFERDRERNCFSSLFYSRRSRRNCKKQHFFY